MTLRNRFVQAPIFTQFASTFGEADDSLIEYHRARARGGVGLIIIENTSIDWEVGRTVGHPIRIDHDRFSGGLADLVEAVHNEGAKIAVQLHHTGRQNSQGNTERNEPPLAPTAGITSAFGTPPRAIEADEIPGLIDKYVQGARRAVAAGFDAVELHGAHGYLLGQFLSPFTNHRTDEWGGSLENRARFALEVVRASAREVGPDFPLLYRLSVEEPYEGGLSLEDGLAFCEMLEPLVDALDVSAGNYDTAMTLLPMVAPGSLVGYAKAVKQRVSVPVIGVGPVDLAARRHAARRRRPVSWTSSRWAGPGWPTPRRSAKTRRGEPERVRRCLAVNECISRWMFNGQAHPVRDQPGAVAGKRAAEARRPVLRRAGARRRRRPGRLRGGDPGRRARPRGGARRARRPDRWPAARLGRRTGVPGRGRRAWSSSTGASWNDSGWTCGSAPMPRTSTCRRTTTCCSPPAPEPRTARRGIDAVAMLSERAVPEADEVTVFGDTETAMFAALWLAEQGKQVTLLSPATTSAWTRTTCSAGTSPSCSPPAASRPRTGAKPTHDGHRRVGARTRPSDVLADQVDDRPHAEIGTRMRGGRMYEATQSGFWTAARIWEEDRWTIRAIEHVGHDCA